MVDSLRKGADLQPHTMTLFKPTALPLLATLAAFPLLAACGPDDAAVAQGEGAATELVCGARQAAPGEPMVYFAPFDEAERQTLCALDLAREELVVAQYNIRRDSYLNKLVELKARGVAVRVAVDQANAAQDWNTGDDFLEQNGIEVVRTKPPGARSIMHLKVAVVDGALALTGSFNWNSTAALTNDENMVVLRDPAVVQAYRQQVLEVLGALAPAVQGGQLTPEMGLHFSPEERLDEVLVQAIAAAEQTVDVAMFTFTSEPVADALVAALDRGVRVRAVIERKQTDMTKVDERLDKAGALVVRGANKIAAHSAMHHKYAVIDGRRAVTGASNWTDAGTRRNDEDLLLVDLPRVAAAYAGSFADLLHVYAEIDDPEAAPAERAGVLLHVIHDGTKPGDRVVATGDHPALGDWDPRRGLELQTAQDEFPNWTGRFKLEAGRRIEYKYVTLTAAGAVVWEPGANRVLEAHASGRALVVSAPFGDTSKSWTPASAP
ncbi:MAG: carbohydrate-binding protein [Deltaproteobacteria bacterium]|nr:carbohydrate-binding protein [Deltaproteobacteria bacterium]